MTEPILTSEAWNKLILVCLGKGTCDVLITVTLAVVFATFVQFFSSTYLTTKSSLFCHQIMHFKYIFKLLASGSISDQLK